jgi:hypothetical protein
MKHTGRVSAEANCRAEAGPANAFARFNGAVVPSAAATTSVSRATISTHEAHPLVRAASNAQIQTCWPGKRHTELMQVVHRAIA